MKKITRLCRLGTLFILFFGTSLFLWNCDDYISNEEISQEKNIIEYGVSKETLLKSKTTKKILSRIQESQRNSNFLNRDTAEELTAEELIDRLDLENTYYSNTDSLEILNAPVKVLGNYKRELLSFTNGVNVETFIITYPNPNDKTVFYISNLNGDLIQKTTIGSDGIGMSEIFNIANTASRSSGDCTELSELIYVACSSGMHSFAYGNAGDCDFWTEPDGTPPYKYTKPSSCSSGGNGGNSGTTGGGGPGGISTAPTGTTGSSTSTGVTTEECISNLDCEDCNLPADINDDCYVFPYEICLENAGVRSNVFNGLSSINQNAIENFINQNGCNEDTKKFVKLAIEALTDNSEVDFEDRIVLDSTFINNEKAKCIYNNLKNISSSYFSSILSDFDNNKISQLKFKVGNIPSSTGNKAVTLPRYGGGTYRTFDIVLDEQFIQSATNLEIALALIHESIHAEIMERCIQLGIISGFSTSGWTASLSFSNGSVISTDLNSILFATIIDLYSNYGGPSNNSNWQHDIFNVVGYRTRISNDLSQAHLWLDDTNNPFENNLNTGTMFAINMDEFFNYISWLGLEGTTDYNNLSNLEKTKKQEAFNQMEQFYNENCN